MGREFELKYAADESVLEKLAVRYPQHRTISMETTYFDTADHRLSAQHMTLRLRRENAQTVCTLKTPLPDGSRGEWECLATDIDSGIAALAAQGAPDIPAQCSGSPLFPVCGARFTRQAADIPTADGMAELALDKGFLLGGGREQSLCEVEIELKSGSESAAVALAQSLAGEYGLHPESKSKFKRAMALAEGE